MKMKFQGNTVVVTGGAGGIGAAVVNRFLSEGLNVASIDRKQSQVQADHSERFLSVPGDVGDPEFCVRAIEMVTEHFGSLDVLVNNAGITHIAPFLDLEIEDFDKVLAINLRAYFIIGQAAARQMVRQGNGGSIINMSSINAVVAMPDQLPYVVSKGGVNQLTRAMALSLAPHGIRVNAIGPGTIATEYARQAVFSSEEASRRLLSRTPLGRFGEPEEVASVAAFLASTDASYFTGQTVYPDGGRLALNYFVGN